MPALQDNGKYIAADSDAGSHPNGRLTSEGWQIIEPVAEELIAMAPRRVEPLSVHPLVVAMLIALGTLAAVTWSSDEWEWERFLEGLR